MQVFASLICTTDLQMWRAGHPALCCPRILGHEIAGRVAEVSTATQGPSVGDRVQVYPGLPCGTCSFCRRGKENLCPSIEILGFSVDGGFAQYLALPKSAVKTLNPIAHSLPYAEAALAEPLGCCLNGLERGGLNPGETVLILGAGPIGCLFAMVARHMEAGKVILVEKDPVRAQLCEPAMADVVVESSGSEIMEAVRELTGDKGAELVIACFREAARSYPLLELTAPGGRVLMFSGLAGGGVVPTDLNRIHYRELTVVGAYGCTAAQCRQAVDLLSNGLEAGWLLSLQVGLDGLEEGLHAVASRNVMKVCVDAWEDDNG